MRWPMGLRVVFLLPKKYVIQKDFVDGNKRGVLTTVYTFLSVNGVELTASEVDILSLEAGEYRIVEGLPTQEEDT